MTMTLVETITVGSGGVASIEFSGIPQDGVDLVVVHSLRNEGASGGVRIWENGNTTQGNNKNLTGNGSGAYSFTNLSYLTLGNTSGQTVNTFGNGSIYIPNYTSAAAKSIYADGVQENNATSANMSITAGVTFGTAAITSIAISYSSGDIAEYSTASLYIIS